ncbi:MAG: ring-cleaving dioxygenase [Bacteroidota bacterium]
MNTNDLIKGLHHVTATVNDAQEDYDFYTHVLGLRLVKKTVNFDNNQVYHFYYGTEEGTPGTIMTTFPYKGQGVRDGINGTGQVSHTAFSVPSSALAFWKTRLESFNIEFEEQVKFRQSVVSFKDPSGLLLELVANDDDDRPIWRTDEVAAEYAIKGFHHVILSVAELEPTQDFLINEFGFKKVGTEGNITRFAAQNRGAGQLVDISLDTDKQRGLNGIGTVHHVAWRVESDEALLAMRHRLVEELGFRVTEVKDRNYFHSIYFRMPGHVLFEIATVPPGFAIDEPLEALGQELKLPKWEEPNREQIESVLQQLN